jgi:hypothetical protein
MTGKSKRKKSENARALEENSKQLRLSRERAENAETEKAAGRSVKSKILRELKQVPIVGKLTNSIMKQVNESVKHTFRLQEKSLARGLTSGQMMLKNTKTLGNLGLGLTGFQNAIDVGFDLFAAGLRDNNKHTGKLALATKLTGGNSAKLLKSLAGLTLGVGATSEQQGELSNSILSLSQRFGLTTEELVDAMGTLGKSMNKYAALGIGTQQAAQAAQLAAALGPAMAGMGTQWLESMSQGSSLATASILGVSSERQEVLSGGGSALQMMVKAGQTVDEMRNSFLQGSETRAVAIEALEQVVGQQGMMALRGYEQLKDLADKQGDSINTYIKGVEANVEANDSFTKTWGNFMSTVWSPIQWTLGLLSTAFLAIANIPGVNYLVATLVSLSAAVLAATSAIIASNLLKKAGGIGGLAKGVGGMAVKGGGLLGGLFKGLLGGGAAAAVGGGGLIAGLTAFLPFILPLAGGLAILSLALLPVAIAFKMVVPHMKEFFESFKSISVSHMFGMAGGLWAVAGGLAAVGAAGLLSISAIPTIALIALAAPALASLIPSGGKETSGSDYEQKMEELAEEQNNLLGEIRDGIGGVEEKAVEQIVKMEEQNHKAGSFLAPVPIPVPT